ncbi:MULTISPECIES: hypothetical protein [unclassified Mesorhizobium]|uniref:hypothetical protein n=1 Tax=unclassified Mesorhizobium TaxID=325217 RepID=UPI0033374F20
MRTRFQSEDHLAAEAGVAPVTYQAANLAASPGDGPATNACAPPSPGLQTTPDMQALGPPKSIDTPEDEDAGILMPCASSLALGCASSGEHGKMACPTIPSITRQHALL